MQPRWSAGVVLTRLEEGRLEVFLVERSRALKFFGGYYAFPGGVVDERDRRDGERSPTDWPEAAARCAQRELYEEVGVLIDAELPLECDPVELRRALIDDTDGAREVWSRRLPTGDSLRKVFEITTPPFHPRRYRTAFFHASLPAGARPEIWPGELVAGRFFSPDEALSAWRRGEMLIAPPVILQLEYLDRHGVEGFADAIVEEERELAAGRLHPVRFVPGIFVAPLRSRALPPAVTTNCFIVGEERLWVVDPGAHERAEQLRLDDELERRTAAGAHLDGVLLTHHHRDHVGGVEHLCRRWGVPLCAHAHTLDRLAPVGVDSGALSTKSLEEGDRIALGRSPDDVADWTLRVLHTPGHAPGHLAFLDERYRSVLVGDLLSVQSTVVIDPQEGHMATYTASLERLLSEDIGMVLPSHGPPVADGARIVRRFIAHRRERQEKILRELQGGARTLEELLPRVYDDTPEERWRWAELSLRAGLIQLEEEGRVRCTHGRWFTTAQQSDGADETTA